MYLLIQLTTSMESSMVKLFLRVERSSNMYLLMQLTTSMESSMVRLFLRVERSMGTLVMRMRSWMRKTITFM